jgi:Rha family phage regulatory protein
MSDRRNHNSIDMAKTFGREHKNVIRDIDIIRPNLSGAQTSWFREVRPINYLKEGVRSFEMTEEGFMLLVMGWNDQRAMSFKVDWIRALVAS